MCGSCGECRITHTCTHMQIRQRFDKGEDVDLSDANPHDIAAVLKGFFRSLPDPLMTRDLFGPILGTRSKQRER